MPKQSGRARRRNRSLAISIAAALALKAAALTVLYLAFFVPPPAPPAAQTAAAVLGLSPAAPAMIDPTVVELSRLQFALTALYHFLFVPLTLGLSLLLAVMESVYVMTGRTIWREMTRFWGVLFGINFAMGVATGITMEFQFGTNWAYYAQYVGDIFGAPLALEGLMAFFLELLSLSACSFSAGTACSAPRPSRAVTWLGGRHANLSALWILIANAWMQEPGRLAFNPPNDARMEVTSFSELIFNPVAQDKFVHTVSAGYVCGSVFVLAISAFYLLRGRHVALAQRSLAVAASFGLASALSVVVLGDESGYTATINQKMKIAGIEAAWTTAPAPASITVFGLPDLATRTTRYAIDIPWVLGLIATRSLDTPVEGIEELVADGQKRIANGLVAYRALQILRQTPDDPAAKAAFAAAEEGPRLRPAAAPPHCRHRQCQPRRQIESRRRRSRPQRAGAVLGISDHGRARLLFHRAVRRRVLPGLGAAARQTLVPAHRDAGDLPCPGSRSKPAGSSPNTAASPGPSKGCCRRSSAPRPVAGRHGPRAPIAGFVLFYSALAVTDVALMVRTIRRGPGSAPETQVTSI